MLSNIYTRKESLKLMKDAFNNKELGAQKGASACRYYDSKTDSHCIIGVLVGKNVNLMDDKGDIPALPNTSGYISSYMRKNNIDTFNGLTLLEAEKLQLLHDKALDYKSIKYLNELESYLFSLI